MKHFVVSLINALYFGKLIKGHYRIILCVKNICLAHVYYVYKVPFKHPVGAGHSLLTTHSDLFPSAFSKTA